MSDKKTLYLTLHKKWFDAIANGTKREEYREQKDYWNKRLKGKIYEEVIFKNGYSKTARKMSAKIIAITFGEWEGKPCFVIHLDSVKQITHDVDK